MKSSAEYQREWRKRNPDKFRAQRKAYRERHKAALYIKNSEWRQANPEKVEQYKKDKAAREAMPDGKQRKAEYGKRWYKSARGRAKALAYGAARRSAAKGLEFSLRWEDIEAVILAGHCQVTGLPFDLNGGHDSWHGPWSPSLDRTDSKGGYTPDNVRVVVCIYNMAKSDFTPDAVVRLARALVGK